MAYLGSPKATLEVINKYGFAFQKRFGQNFLIDSNILENIVSAANITKEDFVLEIGPGIGTMTQYLCEAARQVVAVEIDKMLIPILKDTLSEYDNVEVINQDVLKLDIKALAQEKNIQLIGNCRKITMVGSDILIYRLVYNLVENAVKYNHIGGQVTVTAYRKEKYICLSVEDTGNGIPEELRERVFEPFFRVDKSRSRELGGVGLGLALVHEIVRVHEGSITVKSNPSGGTIFDVAFIQ